MVLGACLEGVEVCVGGVGRLTGGCGGFSKWYWESVWV